MDHKAASCGANNRFEADGLPSRCALGQAAAQAGRYTSQRK